MSYGGNTAKYKLPYPVQGDYIQAVQEQKKANSIDNQIYGAISAHSRGHGVIREGTYNIVASGTSYYVQLVESKTQNLPTIEAFINQVYVSTVSPLVWINFSAGTNYLWVRLVESANYSSLQYGDASTDFGVTSTTPADGLLVGTIVISGTGYTFDPNPTGKVYIPALTDHTNDSIDPHGTTLGQSYLYTSGLTVLGNTRVKGNTQIQGSLSVGGAFSAASVSLSNLTVTGTFAAMVANMGTTTVNSGTTFYGATNLRQNLTISSGLTIDGRDVSTDGATLDAHVANTANPHGTTAAQLGALPTSGGNMTGNIKFTSGLSVDGVDPSILYPLYNGSSTTLHSHVQSSGFNLPFRYISYAPQYANSVVSGNSAGTLSYAIDSGYNSVSWAASGPSPINQDVYVRVVVPEDFNGWSTINLTNTAGSPASVNFYLLDTNSVYANLSGAYGLTNAAWTTSSVTVTSSGSTWTKGAFATAIVNLLGAAGQTAKVADLVFKYIPY